MVRWPGLLFILLVEALCEPYGGYWLLLLLLLPLVFFLLLTFFWDAATSSSWGFELSGILSPTAEPSAECCAGPLGGPFSVCPLHWLFVVYIHGRIGERDTVTSWKWGEKKARNLLVGPFFFPLLYALSISGKSPSFYLYTTPVIGLGPSAIAPSYKIKGTRRAGGKERWMAIACVQAKDKETTGLERESGHMSTI